MPPIVFLLLSVCLATDAATDVELFGQHIFGRVGLGGPRNLAKFSSGSEIFVDLGKTITRGPIKGAGANSLLFMTKSGNSCQINEYNTNTGQSSVVGSCGVNSPSASLGTDLFAFDTVRKEVYIALDGDTSTDYHNQVQRSNKYIMQFTCSRMSLFFCTLIDSMLPETWNFRSHLPTDVPCESGRQNRSHRLVDDT